MAGAVLAVIAASAAVLAAADRLLASAVSRVVARRIGAAASARSRPEVRIAGIPFVTQLLAGRYRRVLVTLAAFTAGGVDFTGLAASLTGVRAPVLPLRSPVLASSRGAGGGAPSAGGAPWLVAGGVAITATIPLAAIDARLPAGLTVSNDLGRLAVRGSVLRVPVSGTVRLDVGRQVISLAPRVLGVPSLVGFEIAMPAMPPELAIESVSVADSGLTVTVRGDRVILARPTGPNEPDQGIAR